MQAPLWLWIAYTVGVFVLLILDLGFFKRRADHEVNLRESALWTAIVIVLSLLFATFIGFREGRPKALEFLSGYLVEYSLSVDNIFIFVVLFNYFAVPRHLQHRVLFWGILVAILLRGLMIWVGVALIARFHWLLYVFGVFLLATGARLLFHRNEDMEPEKNPAVRLCRRCLPMTSSFDGPHFFVKRDARWLATPLFLVFVVVNLTDVVFAVDSIPAIFGLTTDPFIIFTSNICAVLGLRSLYFLVSGVMQKFRHLQTGLALILMFIGAKMLVAPFLHISTSHSLIVVALILATSAIWSLIPAKENKPNA